MKTSNTNTYAKALATFALSAYVCASALAQEHNSGNDIKTSNENILVENGGGYGSYSTDYDSQITANNTTVALEDGDTITSSSTAMNVSNGGEIIVNGAITVNANTATYASAVIVGANGLLNLGSGSHVESANTAVGINVSSASGTLIADNLTIISSGTATNDHSLRSYGTVNLGSNTVIKQLASGNSSVAYTHSGSNFTAVSGLQIIQENSARDVFQLNGNADLGTNGVLQGGRYALSICGTTNVVKMDSFTMSNNSTFASVSINGGKEINISNSRIRNDGNGAGILIALNVQYLTPDGTSTVVNLSNTSVYGKSYALMVYSDGTGGNLTKVLNFTDGCTFTSGNGILLNMQDNATGSIAFNFSGENTVANGRIYRTPVNGDNTVKFADGATWNTMGQSTLANLVLDEGIINFTFNAATDKITTATVAANGGTVNFDLADTFAAKYFNTVDGEFIFSLEGTITNSFEIAENSEINIATRSENYTWLVEYLENNTYRLYNFQLIPEPGTTAAIVAALALAFVAYRRKK